MQKGSQNKGHNMSPRCLYSECVNVPDGCAIYIHSVVLASLLNPIQKSSLAKLLLGSLGKKFAAPVPWLESSGHVPHVLQIKICGESFK